MSTRSSPLGEDARLHLRIEQEAGTSNDLVLAEHEAKIAKKLLCSAERDLQTLDGQIAELCCQRERDAARLQKLRVAVAPHKRLPTEILSYIFRLSSGDKPLEIPHLDDRYPPWTLRHVCSRWRLVVVSDHHLWNRLSMNFVIHNGYSESRQLKDLYQSKQLLSIILPASGSISMSFSISGSTSRVHKAVEMLIAPHSGRLGDLFISLPGNSFPAFLAMFPDQVGALEALELEFFHSFPTAAYSIRDLPSSLHKLTFAGDHSALSCIRSQKINWGHILDLNLFDLEEMTLSEIFSILKCCTNLEKCSFSMRDEDSSSPNEHVVLPYLHSLIVLTSVNSFFDGFTLPSLRHLDVTYFETLPAAEITSMIDRSRCALERFESDEMYYQGVTHCDPEELADLFAASPSLGTLVFRRLAMPKGILEKIVEGDLLPVLKILECRFDTEMINLVSNRLGGSTPEASYAFCFDRFGAFVGADEGTSLIHIRRSSRIPGLFILSIYYQTSFNTLVSTELCLYSGAQSKFK
ncbi:hypothetical protein Hypma_003507 [Hypsizygus marmoreus]|uniref:Uncharacterized protein n=1 Tax=Hypsizygus marmoreus TaxID=39966 RepID=A0A369J869_HYPMA|nr:hypothetical protein Hypma_003507 [Hypsizygus marmoreus]